MEREPRQPPGGRNWASLVAEVGGEATRRGGLTGGVGQRDESRGGGEAGAVDVGFFHGGEK